jgi:transcriptional regulator with XRE-family HTH domain
MKKFEDSYAQQQELLALVLRTIRRERRMKAAEVAEAMGIAPKTYENFEAARGRLDFEKLRRFADATRSDAVAILLSVLFKSPDIALRASDNKISTILWIALHEFGDNVGDTMAGIPGAIAFEAFRQAFASLAEYLRQREDGVDRWLEDEIRRLYRGPTPGEA